MTAPDLLTDLATIPVRREREPESSRRTTWEVNVHLADFTLLKAETSEHPVDLPNIAFQTWAAAV